MASGHTAAGLLALVVDLHLAGSGGGHFWAAEGIEARVVNMATVSPIDRATIVAAASETKGIVTAEEAIVRGGLGGAVCEVLAEGHPVPVERVGLRDVFGQSGTGDALRTLRLSIA